MTRKKQAFKESLADTLLALVINFPLNLLLVWIAYDLQFSALQTSVFLTVIFFLVAVVRKTYTRTYFDKKIVKKYQKTLDFCQNNTIIYVSVFING